jgi:1,2-diacylglycerol 3-alpha-glucosyltransferase
MNIAMFSNVYKPFIGGVGESIETFCADLNRKKHNTLVVTLRLEGADESEPGIFRLPALTNFNGTPFSFKLPVPANLRDRIGQFSPDIVHSHHPFMMGDTALRVARRDGLPIVFTHHTLYERYTYLYAKESKALEKMARTVATEYANLCDLVIAPTESIRKLIIERGVTVPVRVIPTGIDVDAYRAGDGDEFRNRYDIPERAFVFGYLGRVAEVKNMDYLAASMIALLQQNRDAWYLVVGEGESLDPLREKFRKAGVADRLVTTGSLTGSDKADAYAAMDLFPFASTTETQGIVLIEALSAGVPIAALDAQGSRDIVEDRETGRILPPETTPDRFAEELQTIKNDPGLRKRWRRQARAAARKFDRSRCVEELISTYQHLIDHAVRSPGEEENEIWNRLQARFATEWDLFQEKWAAISDGIF